MSQFIVLRLKQQRDLRRKKKTMSHQAISRWNFKNLRANCYVKIETRRYNFAATNEINAARVQVQICAQNWCELFHCPNLPGAIYILFRRETWLNTFQRSVFWSDEVSNMKFDQAARLFQLDKVIANIFPKKSLGWNQIFASNSKVVDFSIIPSRQTHQNPTENVFEDI